MIKNNNTTKFRLNFLALVLLGMLLIVLPFSSAAVNVGTSDTSNINGVVIQQPTQTINYSSVGVNDSFFHQGLTPQQVANLYVETDSISLALINSNNASWSSNFNSTYNTWAYNQTSPSILYCDAQIGLNQSAWSSTFNQTYDNYRYWNETNNQIGLTGNKSGSYIIDTSNNISSKGTTTILSSVYGGTNVKIVRVKSMSINSVTTVVPIIDYNGYVDLGFPIPITAGMHDNRMMFGDAEGVGEGLVNFVYNGTGNRFVDTISTDSGNNYLRITTQNNHGISFGGVGGNTMFGNQHQTNISSTGDISTNKNITFSNGGKIGTYNSTCVGIWAPNGNPYTFCN